MAAKWARKTDGKPKSKLVTILIWKTRIRFEKILNAMIECPGEKPLCASLMKQPKTG